MNSNPSAPEIDYTAVPQLANTSRGIFLGDPEYSVRATVLAMRFSGTTLALVRRHQVENDSYVFVPSSERAELLNAEPRKKKDYTGEL